MKITIKVLLMITILSLKTSCRDLNETARNTRAMFVQRLLKRNNVNEGRVKLHGGLDRYEGNVHIYHAGRWGAICDDSWDDIAAAVVCSAFNMSGKATIGAQFGETNLHYWMDDVVCEGIEKSLKDCKFSGWGISDCSPSEAAGVICYKEKHIKDVSIRQKPQLRVHTIGAISIRLVGGKTPYEGRVEVLIKNTWGSICPHGWTLYEAKTVCRHLGLSYAYQALQTDNFGYSNIVLSGLKCEGNETFLFQCKYSQSRHVNCPGDFGHVAAVICTNKLADLALDVTAIESSAHLQDVPMYQLQCAMEENCLSKSAYVIQNHNPNWQLETRRLLRFTASSLNIGNDDFRPYLPKHLWQWHLCHMHYHSMEVFATFDILNSLGVRVAEGHKASFCLEDNTCLNGIDKKYSCKSYGDQGISVNCSDVYQYNIDCQWVDVTDLAQGDYTLKVAVNPHARVPEQSYHNNAALCRLRLTDTYAAAYGCVLSRP